MMATPRTLLADLLDDHLPGEVAVEPYSRQIDPPLQSTVMVRVDEVTPSVVASGARDYTVALVLIAAQTAPDGAADDELDALLEDVLFACEQASAQGLSWSSAKRATYQESNPAYEVSVSVTIEKNQE